MADLIYKLLIGGVKSLSAICDLRELTLRYAHHCIKMEWDDKTKRHLLKKQMYTVYVRNLKHSRSDAYLFALVASVGHKS